jgi:hypothetical protein
MSLGQTGTSDPLFILAPPLGCSWNLCAALGQHPQMYGLPETHLLIAQSVTEWLQLSADSSFTMHHGLLRALGELMYGEQTDSTIQLAAAWLRRRSHVTTGFVMETLVERTHPRILVEKSPSMVYDANSMRRANLMFPRATFLHVVQHPRAYGEAVLGAIREMSRNGPLPAAHWLMQLASMPAADEKGAMTTECPVDPQRPWYVLNRNICNFLETVPHRQKMWIRAEALRTNPEVVLRKIVLWMGLSAAPDCLDAMRHSERSPFAAAGPQTAAFGTDLFLPEPNIAMDSRELYSLEDPLPWLTGSATFAPEVKTLAKKFGYS